MTTRKGDGPSPLGTLVLTWLLPRRGGAGGRSELGRILAPLLAHRGAASETARLVDDELDALEHAALVSRPRRGAVALTDEGKRHALVALGLAAVPSGASWRSLEAHVLSRALDLPGADKQLASADGLVAALVARHYRLPEPGRAKLRRVRDALGWKLLGAPRAEPFTTATVLGFLLGRELGGARARTPRQALRLLSARIAGARRSDSAELRRAVLRQWLDADPRPSLPRPPTPAPTEKERPLADAASGSSSPSTPDLAAFAACVLEAARATDSGRFGGDKVFISHVWRRLAPPSPGPRESAVFKERLVEAHRAGLLDLSRADLVEAMDPDDVLASETRYFGATFHFVRIDGGAAPRAAAPWRSSP